LEDVRKLGSVEASFIQSWGALARSFGMDPVLGRVHALAFLSASTLTADDVAQTLGLELETAGRCLQNLERWGAVRGVGEPGADELREYEADGDPWSWFLATLRDRGRREFGPLIQSFREANARAQQLRDELHPSARAELRAVERIARFTDFVDQIASIVETFASVGAGPMLGAMKMMSKFRGPRLARS
jgi:DNA-binding transcriptional regulator GbsR (MarR family)